MKVTFLYRDASNYKAWFTAEVIGKEYILDQEEVMENLGLVPEEFVPTLFPLSTTLYQEEEDHNILMVTEVLPDDAETDYTFTFQDKMEVWDDYWMSKEE